MKLIKKYVQPSLSLLFAFAFLIFVPKVVLAESLSINVIPPDSVACNYPSATFTAGGLDPSYSYTISIECEDCSDAGIRQTLYTSPGGQSSFSFTRNFDSYGDCPISLDYPSDTYFAYLTRSDSAEFPLIWTDEDGDPHNYFYIITHPCTLIAPNITAGTPQTIDIYGQPNSEYGFVVFPTNSCTYENSTQTDSTGTGEISINCDGDIPGSHQVTAIISPGDATDVCWAVFDVSTAGSPTPAPCNGEVGGDLGLCYPIPDTLGRCRPPSLFDGQDGCLSGYLCCVPGNQTGFPTTPCTGIFGHSGECYFLQCPPDYYFEGINPPMEEIGCPLLYACCTQPGDDWIERNSLNPQCTTSTGRVGIRTAVGCIGVTSQTEFLLFVLPWAIGVGGGTAFILIIVAGFLVMTSAGDPQRAKAGKELLGAAIAGLLMIIFSVYILDIIGIRILRLPGL